MEYGMTEETNRRTAQIDGLRAMADLLEADPGMPALHGVNISIFAGRAEEAQAVLARATEVVKWEIRKHERPEHRFYAVVQIAGAAVNMWADPAWVCDQGATRIVREWSFRGAPAAVSA
jgi:hypothetical protein